ncbi:MAG: hypothetical protein JWM05_3181 [Acidimicrobiales bacterium]|nr:hypothetical protein [Acidimicrobiales bacterium]
MGVRRADERGVTTTAPVEAPPAETSRPGRRRGVVAVALVAYGLFVVLRLFLHAGDPTVFVAAGDGFTNPHQASDLTVGTHTPGYDGQYFHRLARNPLTSRQTEFGTTFDRPAYRQQRIAYPALVWLVSGGGQPGAVPWALIGVNLAAIGLLAALAADLARDAGRSPWLALVVLAWPGLMVGLARDLSEVVAGALLMAAVLALRRERWAVAAAALVAAALTRETTLVLAAGIVGGWLFARLPLRGWWGSFADRERRVPLWVGLLPLGVSAGWHLALAERWKDVPQTGPKIPSFVGVPLWPLLRQLGSWVAHPDAVALVQLVQVLILAFVVISLATTLADRGAGRAHERLALVAAVAIMSMLPVWDRNVVFLRWADEAVLLGFAVALGAKRLDWRLLRRATGLLWVVTGAIWISIV